MEEQAAVFEYDAGLGAQVADALELHLRLMATLGPEGRHLVADARQKDDAAKSAAARLRLIEVSREVFQLPPLDPEAGQGVGAAACERVLVEFLRWCGQKKSPPSGSPTSSPCSDPSAFPEP